MGRPRRLESHPLTRLEPGPEIVFHHDGRAVPARQGEPVAAALYAAGRTVLSRSMRYHRARGLFCGTGGCTHCFLRIDGVPNERACLAPCRAETWTESQNAIPTADFDVLAAADLAFPRYLDPHTSFIRPAFLKPVYTRVIRGMAGFGRVPRVPVDQSFRREALEPDVLVVGAGPAGLEAARTAATAGLRVTLLEARPRLGGRLRFLPTPFYATRPEAPKVEGKEYAASQEDAVREAGVDVREGATLFGIFGTEYAAATSTALLRIRPRRVVLAVGSLDRADPFPGSDRAGVLLPSAALQLVNLYGILPPDPVVIIGASRDGLLLARDLVACGAVVAGVFDPRAANERRVGLVAEERELGVRIYFQHTPAYVSGRKSPRAIVFDAPHDRVRIRCGTAVLAPGRLALGELFQQAGCALRYDAARRSWHPRLNDRLETSVPGLYAAGSCAGTANEWASVLSGRVAGLAAAQSLHPEPALEARLDEARATYAERDGLDVAPREVVA